VQYYGHKVVSKSDCKAIANRSQSESNRLRSDCEVIAKQLQKGSKRGCIAVAVDLHSAYKAAATRSQRDCKAITKQLQSDHKNIVKR
jgi:hypothetical protein